MKKVLALVLAFAMVFSTISFSFADTTTPVATETAAPAAEISAAAKTCADLGMLQGQSGTVDVAYTATEPTRIQAAIMLLRLKGLEADAKAFTGEKNFADVKADYWAKSITAYLMEHPELGFVGDGTNFKANEKMDAKQYAKVLLTALGYKQTSAEVVGDYTWEGVVEFAKSKGLTTADSATFTIDVLAQATVEALKATAKDAGKTLAASLVEAGKMDAAKAEANGLYTAEKINVADDKVAPAVNKVESDDTNIVKVTFNKPVEKASAGNKENYTIKRSGTSLVIKSIEVKGNKAILTTEGMENAKTYTITVQNVKNLSGIAMKEKFSDTFTGTIDKKAPQVTKVTTKSNIRLNVEFNEELDKVSAETIANYKITGSKGDLEIKSAKLIENDDDDLKWVELITSSQKSGKYTVHVVNVADDSVSLNKITKEDTEDFSGKSKETSAPKLATSNDLTRTYSSNKVLVTFTDESRINFETATNPSNYTFNNDLDVESVEMLDATDDDCKAVIVTTSEQNDDKSYTVTVKNVEDELGNIMDSKGVKASVGKGKTDDKEAPAIAKIFATDTDELKIYFTEIVTKESAENIDNYDFGTLGVEKVVLESKKDFVTVTTAGEMDNKSYSVKIKGIKDLNGNEMQEDEEGINNPKFVGYLDDDSLDIDHPEIDNVDVESKTEVNVAFTEAVRVNPENVKDSWRAPYCEGYGQPVITLAKVENDKLVAGTEVNAYFVGGWYLEGLGKGGYSEDGKTIELKLQDGKELNTSATYRVKSVQNITDLAGNAIPAAWVADNADDFDVSGSDSYSDMAEFESIDQTRPDRIVAQFSRPVKAKDGKGSVSVDGYSMKVEVSDPSKVRVSKTGGFQDGKTIDFDFSKYFVSLQGYDAMDDDDSETDNKLDNSGKDKTEFTTNSKDDDGPVVESVVSIDNKTIKVTFDKRLYDMGNYTLKYTDDEDKSGTFKVVVDNYNSGNNVVYLTVEPDNDKKVLDSDWDFNLKVSNTKDGYGNTGKSDDFDFDGVDNKPNQKYYTGIELVNGSKAYVHVSKAWWTNYGFENNLVTAVKDVKSGITYTVPETVKSLIEYNRGQAYNAEEDAPMFSDDYNRFEIYAAGQKYITADNKVKSAALNNSGKELPAFYAGGEFEIKLGNDTYTWTVDADDDNMSGDIDWKSDSKTLTFNDGADDEDSIVKAYALETNELLATSKSTTGTVAETDWANGFNKIKGDVVFVVYKNGNVIHARLIEDVVNGGATPDVPVTNVTLNKTTADVEVAKTVTLTATVTPDNATSKTVTWTSSDETIASVADGVVTGVKAGKATITAKAGDKTATCEVTVKEAGQVDEKTLEDVCDMAGTKAVATLPTIAGTVYVKLLDAANTTATITADGSALTYDAGNGYYFLNVGGMTAGQTFNVKVTIDGVDYTGTVTAQ